NRNMYEHENKLASIMETQSFLSLAPPQVLTSKSGKKLPKSPVYRIGKILALENTEGLKAIEQPDIIGATRFLEGLLGGAMQRGSVSNIDWGNLNFQLSQVAIGDLSDKSRQIYTPRLLCMSLFKASLGEEIINQFVKFEMSADIGRKGRKRTYTTTDLDGDFTIEYEYHTNLPEETAAAYGLAAAASRWFDDDYIRKNILKVKNAKEIGERFDAQTAERVSRVLVLFKMAESLTALHEKYPEEGYDAKAQLLVAEMGTTLKQLQNGGTTKQLTEGRQTPSPSPQEQASLFEQAPESTRKTEAPGQRIVEEG
ncbi:MAG: hypothetical protein V3V88_04420, partial [Dehalococcoidia bacterium]